MWKNGESMPELTADQICGKIRFWLVIKVLPLVILLVIILAVSFGDIVERFMLSSICVIWSTGIIWRDLMRIKRIKRREFMWCHGVTAGFLGKNMRGTVQVIPDGETVRAFGHPINTFYLRSGIPVYVVKLNVNGNSLLKGGFISDPLAFRIKD